MRPQVCRDCGLTPADVKFYPAIRMRCFVCADRRKKGRRLKREARARLRHKILREGCLEHLDWIRALPCAAHRPGAGCGLKIHAHHVRENTGAGVGIKPHDRWAVPLCVKHHAELHGHGMRTFAEKHRLNLREMAIALAAESPFLNLPPPPPDPVELGAAALELVTP